MSPSTVKNPAVKTIAIITGSVGSPLLARAIDSVNSLDIPDGVNVSHLVVADGSEFVDNVSNITALHPSRNPKLTRHVIALPENTGGDGYLCHRIIAGMSFLTNADYITVLDEDNELDPCHIIAHLNAIGPHRWSFTLRYILDAQSNVVCNDTCESLGNIRPTCISPADRLIDTNCFMIRSDLARELAPLWMVKARETGKLEADRQICHTLLQHEPKGGSTREFTVGYRAEVRQTTGGTGGSVTTEFFKLGNASVSPWDPESTDVYVFHFDATQTKNVLESGQKNPLAEWCMTIFDSVDGVNLIDGYECLRYLPTDAVCLVNMCHPASLPLDYLRQLKETTHTDLKVILATLEGPNLRHQNQWQASFIKRFADVLLTFSRPFLNDDSIRTVYWPHNARFLSTETLPRVLRENRGPGTGTVAMVLENRETSGTYTVHDDVCARSLDHLRREFATGIGPSLTVVGGGWKAFCDAERDAMRPVPLLGYDIPRHRDDKTPIDTYVEHDFALIVENCGGDGAVGYVSEKFGDALIAGAIPVYWGENIDPVGAYETMMKGKNVWWLDARACLDDQGTGSTGPLGEKLRAYLDTFSADDISNMKNAVLQHREAYLLGVGSGAYASSVASALEIVR